MIVTVDLPDGIARQMHLDGPKAPRVARERLVLVSYRNGELSRGQVSELLGLSFFETEALIKESGCGQSITLEEFQQQTKSLQEFLSQ